jgi:hypothetical protein
MLLPGVFHIEWVGVEILVLLTVLSDDQYKLEVFNRERSCGSDVVLNRLVVFSLFWYHEDKRVYKNGVYAQVVI